MPDDPAHDRQLDPATLCLECAAAFIQLGLEVGDTTQLELVQNVRFDDAFGRAAGIWRPGDGLHLEGWWTSAHPRHAMIRNTSRQRGPHYAKLCAGSLQGKLNVVR